MKIYTVLTDCFCEEYLHELSNYPRPGLKEKKLQAGDKVIFIEEFRNFHGKFIVVEKDTIRFHIKPQNLTSDGN